VLLSGSRRSKIVSFLLDFVVVRKARCRVEKVWKRIEVTNKAMKAVTSGARIAVASWNALGIRLFIH